MNITNDQLAAWLAQAQLKTFGAVEQLRFVLDKALATKAAPGMAVQALAGEICEALVKDGKTDGYDLEAGMFGTEFSNIVRRMAALEYAHYQALNTQQIAAVNGAGLPICNHIWLKLHNEYVGARYVPVGRRCQLCDRITTDTES